MQKPCTLCVGCGRCETYSKDINVLTKGGLSQKVATFPCDVLEKVYANEDTLISVDIGTTTVAMTLRRLQDGEVLDTFTALNPQRAYGSDVLSRMEKEDAHQQMKESIEAVICRGMEQFHKVSTNIIGMVITGNTTMLYLLQGLSTKELSVAPFKATHLDQRWLQIGGLDTLLMPGISAFVGADVLAGMFALSMDKAEYPTLLLDLGTNGEMVFSSKDGLIATATPAAPAYEGGNFEEQVYGSDYVSFLAYLLEHGYMDETGLLEDPYFEEGIVVAGHKVTQQDIRRLQLAKAATRAGLEILVKDEVPKTVYLAGGFGYYLDGRKAEQIGLMPTGFGERSVAAGNLALEGAFLYGQSQFARDLARQAHKRIHTMMEQTKVLNLAMQPEFESIYLESMNFPSDL